MIAELHCHSKSSKLPYFPLFFDSVMSVEEIIEECVRKDIGILSITDHDSLAGYWEAKKIISRKKLKIILVPGCEVSSKHGHILAYGILKEIPLGLGAMDTVKAIHDQNGLAVAAHPYITFFSLKNKIFKLKLDGVEVKNSAATKMADRMAMVAARRMGVFRMAGSDAHSRTGIGTGKMIFQSDDMTSWQDVLRALKESKFKTKIEYQSWPEIFWGNVKGNIKNLWSA